MSLHAKLCHVQNMLECSVIHPEQREKVLRICDAAPVNLRGNLSPWPAHRPLTHPRTRSRTSSPLPQSCKRLLRKGCLRLIYNTKHVFVFFITEKQKNPAGTLSFHETSIFKHEIKHASLCVHV
jgi:hypothetical protein